MRKRRIRMPRRQASDGYPQPQWMKLILSVRVQQLLQLNRDLLFRLNQRHPHPIHHRLSRQRGFPSCRGALLLLRRRVLHQLFRQRKLRQLLLNLLSDAVLSAGCQGQAQALFRPAPLPLLQRQAREVVSFLCDVIQRLRLLPFLQLQLQLRIAAQAYPL